MISDRSNTRPARASGILTDGKAWQQLPACPGVYSFYGANNELLYIGKSVNIRNRVRSHFGAARASRHEKRLYRLTRRIECQPTGGELGALLLENHLIKQRQPLFNRRQRLQRTLYTMTLADSGSEGYLKPRIMVAREAPEQNMLSLFRSAGAARGLLERIARSESLCRKRMGLESGIGTCFAFQLGRCAGACCGQQSAADYNQRLHATLGNQATRAWPWSGALVLPEHAGAYNDLHVVLNWRYLGTVHDPAELNRLLASRPTPPFDLDTYRILLAWGEHPHAFVHPLPGAGDETSPTHAFL